MAIALVYSAESSESTHHRKLAAELPSHRLDWKVQFTTIMLSSIRVAPITCVAVPLHDDETILVAAIRCGDLISQVLNQRHRHVNSGGEPVIASAAKPIRPLIHRDASVSSTVPNTRRGE